LEVGLVGAAAGVEEEGKKEFGALEKEDWLDDSVWEGTTPSPSRKNQGST
jgi:hypothetical protein